MGSNIFWNAASRTQFKWDVMCAMQLCRGRFVPISLACLGWVQHITTSVSSCRNHTITTECFVYKVPPAWRRIIHAMTRFLQSCSDIRRMTCFWWQLTHNIAIHTMRLSLKESCLKINVKNVPTLAGCHLATYPESGSCGSRWIRRLIFLLFVSETSQYPSFLSLKEVALFVRLDGEHPSSAYIISRFDLPQMNKIENFIVKPGFVL